MTSNTDTLVYAGLDLPSANKSLTSHADHADTPTSYADINFTAMSKPQNQHQPHKESVGTYELLSNEYNNNIMFFYVD